VKRVVIVLPTSVRSVTAAAAAELAVKVFVGRF
jgi:hypothetical protein